MTSKALITQRGVPRPEAETLESSEATDLGCKVEHHLPQGTLVSGSEQQFEALEARGYRVKLLRDTNILEVGAYLIDIEAAPPKVPAKLRVPKRLEKRWRHHLVQLAGPPTAEWIRAVEEQGVDVVEPISAYGLFVDGTPEEVKSLRNLPFVAWVGPFKPAYRMAPNLQGLKGNIQYVNVGVYPETEISEVRRRVVKAKGTVINGRGQRGRYRILIVEIEARKLAQVARLPAVRWLEYQPPKVIPFDERSAQITGENLDATAPPNTAPVRGYQAALVNIGLSGAGVVVGICDSGVDSHNNSTMHPDLRGRMNFFVDTSGGATTTDVSGHGTHVAGIAVGDATTGDTDPGMFLLGQGVAPAANFGSVNAITGAPVQIGQWTRDMVNNAAQLMNNSWGFTNSAGWGYTANARLIDELVRDPNSNSAALDYLVLVCAAGNYGGGGTTIGSPHEAKNSIVVGNSLNFRPGELFPTDDIRGISGTSSRGPAVDGRTLPTVVAPGTDIISVRSTVDADPVTPGVQRPRTAYTDTAGTVHNNHTSMSGTSMAAPHVSGLCALLIEWWRNRTNGRNPSHSLVKALLVNGSEDLAGGENWRAFLYAPAPAPAPPAGTLRAISPIGFRPNLVVDQAPGNVYGILNPVASAAQVINPGDWSYNAASDTLTFRTLTVGARRLYLRDQAPLANVPNNDQGWGRASLENIVLQAPDSDRGPKIFLDQRHAFTANGQRYMIRVAPVDTGRPMRITLVWTDAPGAANANPALVNDLDLEVTEVATGNIYRGNVFVNGFSTIGGNFDNLNNIECVYVQNPNGVYEVRVIATNIRGNARPPFGTTPWQDFSLVIDNAEVPPAAPVSVVPVIDRSGSMKSYGYVDITRISSKQFVDLMGIDDKVGVVSFGHTGVVEYPTGAAPSLQTITGQPIRDAAKTEIDGITFGGCTYMGDGILKARELLNPPGGLTGSRAMVLLSDGYDNRGCQSSNTARPSARSAVTTLPADMPVYTCAMGPTSDQTLLEDIANTTNGRYYYVPTIDDLFEIYNYIRGQVTGEGIIVNESAIASSSSVRAWVDALATEVTFTVAWADTNLHFVAREPEKPNELTVRLLDPNGQLLHPSSSYVRRTVGAGYVAFELQEPVPGQWHVEVQTKGETHVRHTVGGFVRSPLRLEVQVYPREVKAGTPLRIAAQVFDGKWPIKDFRAYSVVTSPSLSIARLLRKYKTQLAIVRPARAALADGMPRDMAKLVALRNKLSKEKEPDIFATKATPVRLSGVTIGKLTNIGLGHLMPPDAFPVGVTEAALPVVRLSMAVAPIARVGPVVSSFLPVTPVVMQPSMISGVLTKQFKNTKQQGSHNVVVTADGTSPVSGTRFVRKQLVSVLVR